MKKYLILLCVAALLLVLIGSAYLKIQNYELKSLLLNLSTEIIGALLTYLIFDQIFQARENKENRKKIIIAVQQFNSVIYSYVHILSQMYKASTTEVPKNIGSTCLALFDDEFYKNIKYFDIKAKAPILREMRFINGQIVEDRLTWIEYLLNEFIKYDKLLNEEIGKYAIYINDQILAALMKIVNSKPSDSVLSYIQILKITQQTALDYHTSVKNIQFYPTAEHMLKALIGGICDYEKAVKKTGEESIQKKLDMTLWNDNMAPKIGDSRVVSLGVV